MNISYFSRIVFKAIEIFFSNFCGFFWCCFYECCQYCCINPCKYYVKTNFTYDKTQFFPRKNFMDDYSSRITVVCGWCMDFL